MSTGEKGEYMKRLLVAAAAVIAFATFGAFGGVAQAAPPLKPMFSKAAAFDVSKPLREMTPIDRTGFEFGDDDEEEGPEAPVGDTAHTTDGALQSAPANATIPAPLFTFEGASNKDNFNIFGFRVNPPDTNMDVGRTQIVEMINLVFDVYNKSGNLLLGPVDTGTLWSGFPIPDCTDPSGDPVVLYDQTTDHWILTQFTTRGLDAQLPFYNCVAVSVTGDATGAYYRYAFPTQPDVVDGGYFFPDYPKYGVWSNSYIMTTRDFGWIDRYGISVYALEKNKMVNGEPNARAVQFFLEVPDVVSARAGRRRPAPARHRRQPPADADRLAGARSSARRTTAQDTARPFGRAEHLGARGALERQSHAPRSCSSRSCRCRVRLDLPVRADEPRLPPAAGHHEPAQYLDILSYRQRPTFRLAYRNFGTYESLVTNQAVEAHARRRRRALVRDPAHERRVLGLPAGHVRTERRRPPLDGQHRAGQEGQHGARLQRRQRHRRVSGYSLHRPSRRRPARDMTLGEGTIANGTGVQTTINSRWGDYTLDDHRPHRRLHLLLLERVLHGGRSGDSTAGWQTRIGAFKFPGCKPGNG